MKKILTLTMLMLLTFALAACRDTEPDPNGGNGGNGGGNVRNITLSYADWGNQEVNQALVDAFMLEYPHITVDLRRDITGAGGEFTANLLNAQAAGVLPDVFAIDNVPTGLSNGMIMDITEYWDNDPDTELIYPNIAETAVYNGRRYAVPSFQFIKGIYINLTLLDYYNIPIPEKDWTYDEFVALAIQIRQAGQNDFVYAIDPWFGDLDFEAIWPTQDFEDVGYQTFDGTRFNFNTPMWIDAYNAKLDLWAQGVVAQHTPEEMAVIGDVWPWLAGYTAMSIDGSWNLWMVDVMFEDYGFEVGFWPYPGGAAGQFPPTILDYAVVSSQTEHPEEAYLLAKWMTFGRRGWEVRLDVMENRGDLYLDRFPVADYPEIWERAENFVDYVEGVRESVELFEFSKPDVDKWLPGYKAFWEWVESDDNDYWTRIGAGLITPEVFAAEWEAKLNEMIQEALDEYLN
jgi:multiple sugar transport system substrate-binding protein